jgi:hypothetical protein
MSDVAPPLQPYKEGVNYRPNATSPQINFGKVGELLHECSYNHEQCSRIWQGPKYGDVEPTLFIDVERGTLVEGDTSWKYLAMSYAWGKVSLLQTTKQNLEKLKTSGGLSSARSQIPQTIRDAIALTSHLKVRLLWIDCLCIVQDDAERKHDAIQNMDIIYSQAFATIVAAEGRDAQSGFSGVQNMDRNLPINADIMIRGFNFGFCSPVVQSFDSSQPRCYQYERAWTLQEMSLSRRVLYVFKQQAFVVCLKSVRGETRELDDRFHVITHMFALFQILYRQVAQPCTDEEDHDDFMRILNFPAAYRSIVSTYTAASLSYPQGVLNAFAGFAAVLSDGFRRQSREWIFPPWHSRTLDMVRFVILPR